LLVLISLFTFATERRGWSFRSDQSGGHRGHSGTWSSVGDGRWQHHKDGNWQRHEEWSFVEEPPAETAKEVADPREVLKEPEKGKRKPKQNKMKPNPDPSLVVDGGACPAYGEGPSETPGDGEEEASLAAQSTRVPSQKVVVLSSPFVSDRT
jgi:hypothetical protein